MANVQNRPHVKLEEQYDVTNDTFVVDDDADLVTKEYVDDLVSSSGTEYTAGDNITIVDDVIDTKRVVELTDITIADGTSAIKIITTANGSPAIVEGYATTASGEYSHAEGYNTTANGGQCHAEGQDTTANGSGSHAEGQGCTTHNLSENCHAEGYSTTAEGRYCHAEGVGTLAKGEASHAEGRSTIARGENQHASGKFNIEDTTGAKLFIVGNGTSATRHNAFSVNTDNSITVGDTTITEAQLIALIASLN